MEQFEARRLLAAVLFDPFAVGDSTKSVHEWGVDTAWPNDFNFRQSVENIGLENVDIVRVNFYLEHALNADGTLSQATRDLLDNQLRIANTYAPGKPIALTPTIGGDDPNDTDHLGNTHVYYLINVVRDGNNKPISADPDVDRWLDLMKASILYVEQQTGREVTAIEPFNEPDLWKGQGTPEQLNEIMTRMVADPEFNGMLIQGASTLASELSYFWYDRIRGPANSGTTHLLGSGPDALASYAGFFPYVKSNGTDHSPDDIPYNPEVHSMAEEIVGADRGMEGGIFWAIVERPRALFTTTSDGNRLGYAEDLVNQNAAAIYRGPDGEIRGFAGGIERAGTPTQYQFTSTTEPVYFNGIGPISSFSALASIDQQTAVEIDTSAASAVPALDGYRWKIVNRATGELLDVFGASSEDGGNIALWPDNGGLNQLWDIRQQYKTYNGFFKVDDYLYFENVNSGRMAEVANFSLNDGANVQQYGLTPTEVSRHWYIKQAGDGYFYIVNANSNKYLSADSNATRVNVVQNSFTGSQLQQWEFVLANPDPASGLQYAQDVAGTFSVVSTFGNPTYVSNPPNAGGPGADMSIVLDGVDDYVQLDAGVADSDDLTVAAWVKWNGGDAWQRIFDFGNNTDEYMFLTPSSGGNTLSFRLKNGGEELSLDVPALSTDEWHHVAITLGGNTGILYVDGEAVTAGQIPTNPSDFTPAMNYVGKSQFNDPLFKGMISDFAVYDLALSPDQIAAMAIGSRTIDTLQIASRTSNSVTIEWDDLTVEDGYRVEASSDGVNWTFLGDAAQNVTTWTESELTEGAEHYYRVLPFNQYGEGIWNNVMAATPDDSLPYPWASQDVGAVGGPGAAINIGADAWMLIDGGSDIWDVADSFHFLYRQLTGDGEIVARVDMQENTHGFAKAGVMIRESLDANSAYTFAALTPENGAEFSRRTATGVFAATGFQAGVAAPHWIRLVRQGDTFTAFESADGVNWNQYGTETIAMSDTVYLGLAQTSHDTSQLNTSSFSHVELDSEFDYGDAPTAAQAGGTFVSDYPVTGISDGARHLAVGPRLGANRDTEVDGVASVNADSDGSDEDGVMFGVIGIGSALAGVNIDLQNAAAARVDAWLDFDLDGIWQADEKILDNVLASDVPGFQTFNFSINADAVAGDTYARVRVSSAGGLDATGSADDGEVEDYRVTLHAGAAPTVETILINANEHQRSILHRVDVTFDSEVTAPASAFQILHRGSGQVLDTLLVNSAVNGQGKTVSTLTFGDNGNLVQNRADGENSLIDGNYELHIDWLQVAKVGGGPSMAGDSVIGDDAADLFFRYFTDHDGDRDSDSGDLVAFAGTFRSVLGDGRYNSLYDADGDGDVDSGDLIHFANRFRRSMPFV